MECFLSGSDSCVNVIMITKANHSYRLFGSRIYDLDGFRTPGFNPLAVYIKLFIVAHLHSLGFLQKDYTSLQY